MVVLVADHAQQVAQAAIAVLAVLACRGNSRQSWTFGFILHAPVESIICPYANVCFLAFPRARSKPSSAAIAASYQDY